MKRLRYAREFGSTINKLPILHASISCKWTLQNDKSEALNFISEQDR